MSNWCQNYCIIKVLDIVAKLEIKSIETREDGDCGLFEFLTPYLQNLKKDLEEELKLHLENWRCKWDAHCINSCNEYEIHLSFETPWGPPIPWYKNIKLKYNLSVKACYFGPRMSFCGYYEDNHDKSFDYGHYKIKYIRKHLPKWVLNN